MSLSDYYKEGTLEEAFTPENLRLFEDWYIEFLKGDYKPTTISSELSYVKVWIEECQERGIDITEATESQQKRYLRRCQGRLSDSALSSTATSLRKWHDWLVEAEFRDDDPMADIELDELFNEFNPGVPERDRALKEIYGTDELKTITPDVVDEMGKYCGSPRTRNELLIRLGFQTAMRPVELVNARVDKIKWDERAIDIETAKADPDHPYDTRLVFWHKNLDSLMYRWLGGPDSSGGGERAAYKVHEDSPYIFLTRKSKQMRPEYASRIVREAAQRAGVQKTLGETARQVPQNEDDEDAPDGVPLYQISGHELRRASITHYVNKVDALDLHEVQALAGHKRISQTRSYVEDDWEQMKQKMRRITF